MKRCTTLNRKNPAAFLPQTLSLLLILITLAVFFQVRHYQFINMDDESYISQNPYLAEGVTRRGIVWALTADFFQPSRHADYWQPLTFFSRMVDIELFGLNPGGHHVMNLWFHIVNVLLLFSGLRFLTGSLWRSAFVAAVFAVHPLQVEPVAWITARKDVLSTFFGLLTLGAYIKYAHRPSRARYELVFLLFLCTLMAKPMLVTLPFLMLLLDGWPLGRLANGQGHRISIVKLFIEKAPLLFLSVASSALTLYSQAHGLGVDSLKLLAANIPVDYMWYLGKAVLPVHLAIRSTQYGFTAPLWFSLLSVFLLVLICFSVLRQFKKRPYLAVGWFWFFILMIPVIILRDRNDRFMYVPLIGLAVMAAWGIPEWFACRRYRRSASGISGAVIVMILMAVSWRQTRYWKNSVTLFSHAIRVTKNNYKAQVNLGSALMAQSSFQQAAGHFAEALREKSMSAKMHSNLGLALANTGRTSEAISQYQTALRFNSGLAKVHTNLGAALTKKKKWDDAVRHLRKAIHINPNLPDAHYQLGYAFDALGQFDKAVSEYQTALKLYPDFADALNDLGVTLAKQGKYDQAVIRFKKATLLAPDHVSAHYNLAKSFAAAGKAGAAIREYEKALALDPRGKRANNNLAALFLGRGEIDRAIGYYRKALAVDPGYGNARYGLGAALARKTAAEAHLQK